MGSRQVTEESLGAWLVKASPTSTSDLPGAMDRGLRRITSRCVAASYRSAMMRPGHRILLWVSGDGRRMARGLWGAGWVTSSARQGEDGLEVAVDLELFTEGLSAAAVRAAGIDLEVLRVPAGSNPSWVSRAQLAALEELLPPWPPAPREGGA